MGYRIPATFEDQSEIVRDRRHHPLSHRRHRPQMLGGSLRSLLPDTHGSTDHHGVSPVLCQQRHESLTEKQTVEVVDFPQKSRQQRREANSLIKLAQASHLGNKGCRFDLRDTLDIDPDTENRIPDDLPLDLRGYDKSAYLAAIDDDIIDPFDPRRYSPAGQPSDRPDTGNRRQQGETVANLSRLPVLR